MVSQEVFVPVCHRCTHKECILQTVCIISWVVTQWWSSSLLAPTGLDFISRTSVRKKKVSVYATSTFSSLLVFITKVIFLLEILKYIHLCSKGVPVLLSAALPELLVLLCQAGEVIMTNVLAAQGCECGSSAPVLYMACVGGCARLESWSQEVGRENLMGSFVLQSSQSVSCRFIKDLVSTNEVRRLEGDTQH